MGTPSQALSPKNPDPNPSTIHPHPILRFFSGLVMSSWVAWRPWAGPKAKGAAGKGRSLYLGEGFAPVLYQGQTGGLPYLTEMVSAPPHKEGRSPLTRGPLLRLSLTRPQTGRFIHAIRGVSEPHTGAHGYRSQH